MEGTHAHHCSLPGGSPFSAIEVDVEASSPTSSSAPSLKYEERGHDHPQADSSVPQLADHVVVVNCSQGNWKPPNTASPSHQSSNSGLSHLPSRHSHRKPEGSSQRPPEPRSSLSPRHRRCLSLPPCGLDPNAREFTPAFYSSLQLAIHTPLINMQPAYAAHSEIRASVCYETNVAPMQIPCEYGLGDTTLRVGPVPEIVTANDSPDAPASTLAHVYIEPGHPTFDNVQVFKVAEDCTSAGQHVNGCDYAAASETASQLGSVGVLTPVHERSPMSVYNPTILTNPQVGLLTSMAMPFPPPFPPLLMPHFPSPVTSIAHPQQALTVYTHKHFHPHFGWKEHISRALLISGIPPHLTESQLQIQLEQWGNIRALYADKLPQGMLSVEFFDLRASRQALRDMQNQHLLRQQRFQEHLYAQSGMQFHSYSLQSCAPEQGWGCKGLLVGHVVWAQYIAAWSVPVPDGHNQGTLVVFNVGADVSLERLRQVFEKYGLVRELREAPTKRQHKFVEFYDTRDAEAAWIALNGQEVCGKCVKIEFSRQGRGPLRKQKSVPVSVHQDMVSGQEVSSKDTAFCGWQSYNTSGYYHQEWHATKFFEGNPPPLPRSEITVLPNVPSVGQGECPSYIGSSVGSENWCASEVKDDVNQYIPGAISGPRRRHSNGFRSHPDVSDVVVHGRNNTLGLRPPAGTIRRNVRSEGHPHFEYNEREVYLISGHPRTTLMVKNIPNKYSQQMLLSLLDHHCVQYNSQIMDLNEPESAYDFVYLPIDFKNRCNLGYAFVNFTSALATLKFYRAFHAQAWEEFNSRKICDIKYARVQGRHALENHFCNSRFACDTLEYLPVVFAPPRNGLQCSPPRVAAGLIMIKSERPSLGITSSTAGVCNPIESSQKSSTISDVEDETKHQLDIKESSQVD